MLKYSAIASVALLSTIVACGTTSEVTNPGATDGGSELESPIDGSAATDASTAKPTGGCTFGEPNDTRDVSTKLGLDTAYTACTSREDDDFYEFTTPEDGAGGLVEIALTNVKGGSLEAELFSTANNDSLGKEYESTDDADLRLFLGAGPGITYRLRVKSWGSSGKASFPYDVKLTYTKTSDSFEPNDARADAKPLGIAKPNEGLFAPTVDAEGEAAWDDWFVIDLASGGVTIKLEDVPLDVSAEVELYNGDGKSLGRGYETTKGANVTLEEAVTAGKHFVRVSPWASVPNPSGFGKGALPDHLKRKYKLTATQ